LSQTSAQLFEEIKIKLEQRREELLRKIDANRGAVIDPHNKPTGDDADKMNANFDLGIQSNLNQRDIAELRAIDIALAKINEGTFGICEECHGPIGPGRLRALPFTNLCITCKEKNEEPIHRPRSRRPHPKK
jgi:DnaK suppressor protein